MIAQKIIFQEVSNVVFFLCRVPNADDDTFTVVSSNGTLGKKKKKKAKWPGLKYEVSVPPIRRGELTDF